jgi:iron complex outermembrane recepter protein
MSGLHLRWAATILLAQCLFGQSKDLTSMSFEDFMNVEVVSVSKSRQKLAQSAAAVYVITREDIRRSGATSLPEVLRLAPGVFVARLNGLAWVVGIRGFNNIDSNKLQVLVDGRSIYNPLMSGVVWTENVAMLDDIERIEVIRGPGATMWGANSVAGVINIITRSAQDTVGGSVTAVGGGFDPLHARFRYGGKAGEKVAWRAWGEGSLFGQTPFAPGGPRLDRWGSERGGFRMDVQPGPRDTLLVEGEINNVAPDVLEWVAGPRGAELRRYQTGDTDAHLMGRWNHTTAAGHEVEVQLSAEDDQVNAGAFTGRVQVLDAAAQDSFHMGVRHTLMLGAGVRGNLIETSGTPEFSFDPASRNYYVGSAFVEDGWELVRDRLTVSAGARVEAYSIAGGAVEPMARVSWTPDRRQAYWASFSRAVRTPCHVDYAVRTPMALPGLPVVLMLQGNSAFRPELMNGFEAGARHQIRRRVALDIAAFRHRYAGLQGYTVPVGPDGRSPVSLLPGSNLLAIPLTNANAFDGVNQGVELTVQWELRKGVDVTASYSSLFSSSSLRPGFNPASTVAIAYYTPKHMWQIRPHWEFARWWSADLALYRAQNFPGGVLGNASRLDLRLARRLGEYTEVSVSGQNLLRPYTQEMVGTVLYPGGLVPRSVEVGLHWTF